MKTITILGQEFKYRNHYFVNDVGIIYQHTDFYTKMKTEIYKPYWFLKKIEKYEVPIVLFTVSFDIERPTHTKEELREILERKVKLLSRKGEILKGELI